MSQKHKLKFHILILEEIQKCCKRWNLPATSSWTAWSKSEIKRNKIHVQQKQNYIVVIIYTYSLRLGILSELMSLELYASLSGPEIPLLTSAGLIHYIKKGIIFPITFNNDSSKAANLHLSKSFHMPFLNKSILITIKNTLEEKFYTTSTSISYYTLFHM